MSEHCRERKTGCRLGFEGFCACPCGKCANVHADEILKHVDAELGKPDPGEVTSPLWRVGKKLGRTLYFRDACVGMVDTPEMAAAIVEAMNQTTSYADRIRQEVREQTISEAISVCECPVSDERAAVTARYKEQDACRRRIDALRRREGTR